MNTSRNELGIYTLLAAITSAYTAALSTPAGRRFTDEHTAETVVIGVSLVLAALRLVLPKAAWWRVAVAFAVAGLPLVGRSLVKRTKGIDEMLL